MKPEKQNLKPLPIAKVLSFNSIVDGPVKENLKVSLSKLYERLKENPWLPAVGGTFL